MANLKGSTFLARLAFLESRFGEEGRATVWSHLDPEERTLLEGDILPGGWYSRDLFNKLVDLIDQELGDGDHRLTRQMGYFAAGLQLRGAYDSFVRPGDPDFLLAKAGNIWQLFHDFGRVEAKTEPGRCRIWLKSLGFADIGTVEGIIGWTQQGLELSGCKDIRYRYLPRPSPNNDAYEVRFVWRLE